MRLFYSDSEITSAAQIVNLIQDNKIGYHTLNTDITDEGVYQLYLYLKSALKPSLFSNVIIQTMNDLYNGIEEFKSNDPTDIRIEEELRYQFQNIVLNAFVENLKD